MMRLGTEPEARSCLILTLNGGPCGSVMGFQSAAARESASL